MKNKKVFKYSIIVLLLSFVIVFSLACETIKTGASKSNNKTSDTELILALNSLINSIRVGYDYRTLTSPYEQEKIVYDEKNDFYEYEKRDGSERSKFHVTKSNGTYKILHKGLAKEELTSEEEYNKKLKIVKELREKYNNDLKKYMISDENFDLKNSEYVLSEKGKKAYDSTEFTKYKKDIKINLNGEDIIITHGNKKFSIVKVK